MEGRSEQERNCRVPQDRDGWGLDSMRPDRDSMRPDREFAVAGGYLATFACLFLGALMGSVLGGLIGSNLGSWLGGRAGDAAQAAGRACQGGFVDCRETYASDYALRFGAVGVLVGLVLGLVVGLVVGRRLGRRIVRDAWKSLREATWFTQVPRPTPTTSGTRQDAARDPAHEHGSVQDRSVLASEGARCPAGAERTLTWKG